MIFFWPLSTFTYWVYRIPARKILPILTSAILLWYILNPVKPLNSGHLRVLKKLPVIKRCPLLWGSLTKILTFQTKHFVRYWRHIRYLGCPILGGFTKLRIPTSSIASITTYHLQEIYRKLRLIFFAKIVNG